LSNLTRRRTALLTFLGGQILVALLGVADFLTGDYSLVIFYLIPIGLTGWQSGWRSCLVAVLTCGGARFISDYALHGASVNSPLHYWNYAVEVIFFGIVAALVAALKRALSRRD
jgi:hypothetical protein